MLVESGTVRELAAVEDPANKGLLSVGYFTGGTRPLTIDALISNGRIRSLLDVRDTTVRGLQQSFDRLPATLVNEVNQIHRQGFGLDGTTGRDFFSPLVVTTESSALNQGTAAIGAGVVTAGSLLTQHDYEIRFATPTTYSIVDATTGATIKGNYTGTPITAPSAGAPLSMTFTWL